MTSAAVVKAFENVIPGAKLADDMVGRFAGICASHGIDPSTLANQWEAYALNAKIDADVPNVVHVQRLADKLSRKARPVKAESKVYTRDTFQKLAKQKQKMNGMSTPPFSKRNISSMNNSAASSSRTPASGPPSKTMRSNTGASFRASGSKPAYALKSGSPAGIALTFNEQLTRSKGESKTPAAGQRSRSHAVTVLDGGEKHGSLYMYSTLEERAAVLENHLIEMTEAIVKAHNLRSNLEPVGHTCQHPVLVAGRICCESEGKLGPKSLVLEGSRASSNGRRIHLNVADGKISTMSVFPGQIVVVGGMCTNGREIVVNEMYTSAPPPRAMSSAEDLLKRNHGSRHQLGPINEPSSIVVATGPYCSRENTNYEPLDDLISQIEEMRPNVIILMGPFVDANHPSVASGQLFSNGVDDNDAENNNGEEAIPLTYQDMYEIVLTKLSILNDSLPKLKIVLVPSLSDVTHTVAYPQAPLTIPKDLAEDFPQLKSAICVPNPAVFRVNDVVFGVSHHDVHFHMIQDDVVVNNKRDRMVRLTSHLFDQRSYYPIFPPPASAAVDFSKQGSFSMGVKPDILICPTRLNHFAKDVQGTLCINPGKVTRGSKNGMYAHLSIHPMPHADLTRKAKQSETVTKAENISKVPHGVSGRTRVDIVRL